MKSIKKNDKYQRINDEEAKKLVRNSGWSYCPKEEYKSQRDGDIIPEGDE